MKFIVILSFILFHITAMAHFDLSTGGSLRTYPALGAEANFRLGYNYKLWGNGPGQDKKKVLYGLVRPAISAATSVVVNNYDLRLEVYPISLIGLIIGKKHVQSDFEDFPFYDCDEVRCTGSLVRDYTQFKMALGFWKILAVGQVTMSKNTYSDEDNEEKPVAEFRFAALANPKEDTMYRSRYILGFKHQNRGIIGIVAEYVAFTESEQTHNMDLLIYTTKPAQTTYVFGIGQFSSTHQAKGLIGVFQMKTDFIPSDKLF